MPVENEGEFLARQEPEDRRVRGGASAVSDSESIGRTSRVIWIAVGVVTLAMFAMVGYLMTGHYKASPAR